VEFGPLQQVERGYTYTQVATSPCTVDNAAGNSNQQVQEQTGLVIMQEQQYK
jgi:hypothetical protein